jgi:hypothetical protein
MVISGTQLTVVSPQNYPLGTGTANIVVVTSTSGESPPTPAAVFTYTLSATPTVTGLNPASGPASGQTMLIVTGSGFAGATGVQFGTAVAKFEIASDTQVFAFAPAGSGTVDVTVTTAVGTSAVNPADQFTYS